MPNTPAIALGLILALSTYPTLAHASYQDPNELYSNAESDSKWQAEHSRNQYQADQDQRQEQQRQEQQQSYSSPAERLSDCAYTNSCAGAFAPRY